MATIYSVNVGANSSHCRIARSPLFSDGRFIYVSFPTKNRLHTQSYPAAALPFLRQADEFRTHADPDWTNLTYGDYCINPRAGALKNARPGDILLFWGLLWLNHGDSWTDFVGARDWCLLGAIRIAEILRPEQPITSLTSPVRQRAKQNAHLDGDEQLRAGHYVFIGALNHSALFSRAVSLGVSNAAGLLYRAFTAANGQLLTLNGNPAWKSSLRSCRIICDLSNQSDRARAQVIAQAIRECNDFDLLGGL